jgi:hypothetical protein
MSPPTEQLIRDYLNRLSVAARGRLNPEDRQALVMRTRDFIERKVGSSGPADPMQVAALLSRLGDPAALVNQEVARLAAVRGEPVPPTERSEANRPRLLRRRSGQASWHWPRPVGSPDLQVRLLNGVRNHTGQIGAEQAAPEAVPDRPGAEPEAPAAASSAPAVEPMTSAVEPKTSAEESIGPAAEPRSLREPPIWVPRQAPAPEALSSESVGRPGHAASAGGSIQPSEPLRLDGDRLPSAASGGRPSWPSVVAMSGGASGDPATTATTGAELDPASAHDGLVGPAAGQPVLRTAAALLGVLVSQFRQSPVEAVAVALLGLGGAVYPPVWLLGAIVALVSQQWDYRDKWVGLAGPVLLLIVGTTAGVSLTEAHASMSSFMHEGWMYADVLSRVGAVLGAAYLAWRVSRGRRGPAVPPWSKPRNLR